MMIQTVRYHNEERWKIVNFVKYRFQVLVEKFFYSSEYHYYQIIWVQLTIVKENELEIYPTNFINLFPFKDQRFLTCKICKAFKIQ